MSNEQPVQTMIRVRPRTRRQLDEIAATNRLTIAAAADAVVLGFGKLTNKQREEVLTEAYAAGRNDSPSAA